MPFETDAFLGEAQEIVPFASPFGGEQEFDYTRKIRRKGREGDEVVGTSKKGKPIYKPVFEEQTFTGTRKNEVDLGLLARSYGGVYPITEAGKNYWVFTGVKQPKMFDKYGRRTTPYHLKEIFGEDYSQLRNTGWTSTRKADGSQRNKPVKKSGVVDYPKFLNRGGAVSTLWGTVPLIFKSGDKKGQVNPRGGQPYTSLLTRARLSGMIKQVSGYYGLYRTVKKKDGSEVVRPIGASNDIINYIYGVATESVLETVTALMKAYFNLEAHRKKPATRIGLKHLVHAYEKGEINRGFLSSERMQQFASLPGKGQWENIRQQAIANAKAILKEKRKQSMKNWMDRKRLENPNWKPGKSRSGAYLNKMDAEKLLQEIGGINNAGDILNSPVMRGILEKAGVKLPDAGGGPNIIALEPDINMGGARKRARIEDI